VRSTTYLLVASGSPGPRLDPATQPRLFAEIRRTASPTRQAEPADVFLLADVNAFVPYWSGAVGPLLSAGFLPPLTAGFDAFREAPWLAGLLSSREPAAENPFDTHPPLSARLAALGVRERLASRPEAVAAWQELCTRVGIADIDLGSLTKTRAG
jgi:hypothetical protein